ncbi:FkbM family methyltransferase [Algoriphagus marincola]|uniref:FkbM family methyltransferase n=1 Tax=Algoriphagus marincola TaxID=264027 RepID=UPI00042969DD|nr:FkbM family methyltransferase [Algoriphagus marincola]
MRKSLKILKIFGLVGLIIFIIYKLLFQLLHAFRSSLILFEFVEKHGFSMVSEKGLVKINGLPNFFNKSLFFRPFTTDALVVRQHFFDNELLPIIKYFKSTNICPKLMIDAGGNIGVTSCYMHWYFPGMRSLVLEPSIDNIQIAKMNLGNEKTTILNKALWWKEEILFLDNSQSAWAMKVSNSDNKGKIVKGISLSKILSSDEFKTPDYIKIDIEGSEEAIFENDKDLDILMSYVSCISVEPHSQYGKELILKKLTEWKFRIEYHGELIIGFR